MHGCDWVGEHEDGVKEIQVVAGGVSDPRLYGLSIAGDGEAANGGWRSCRGALWELRRRYEIRTFITEVSGDCHGRISTVDTGLV